MKNRIFIALFVLLLLLLLILLLASCEKGAGRAPTDQIGSEEFQKNMHQSNSSYLLFACETEGGFYFTQDAYVYFMDKETKRVTIVCGKPECAHRGETCNAWVNAHSLWLYDGKLYYSNGDAVEENGSFVDYGERLYSLAPDGTGHRAVQALEREPGGNTALKLTSPIMHRGVTYFAYCEALYALPLGGDFKDAKKIWGEERDAHSGDIYLYDPNEISYDLWADGDLLYFMVNLPQPDGTYKDTLFAYDIPKDSTRQVWQTPDADEVGQWETTGVSVNQWYVWDGIIYFYLAGGGFWKTDLTTGKTVKLADTHEKTAHGSAIFSDETMCLLNNHTDPELEGAVSVLGGVSHTGGDTVYVYGMDGRFAKELSLASLYEEKEELRECELVFCADREIYFMANAGHYGPSGYIRDLTLCSVNIDTGEITQIYNWQ